MLVFMNGSVPVFSFGLSRKQLRLLKNSLASDSDPRPALPREARFRALLLDSATGTRRAPQGARGGRQGRPDPPQPRRLSEQAKSQAGGDRTPRRLAGRHVPRGRTRGPLRGHLRLVPHVRAPAGRGASAPLAGRGPRRSSAPGEPPATARQWRGRPPVLRAADQSPSDGARH